MGCRRKVGTWEERKEDERKLILGNKYILRVIYSIVILLKYELTRNNLLGVNFLIFKWQGLQIFARLSTK